MRWKAKPLVLGWATLFSCPVLKLDKEDIVPQLDPIHTRAQHTVQEYPSYQGFAGTCLNKGKSLLANQTKDGHMCADDLQPNKGTCRIITLNSEDVLRTWKDYLWHAPKM